MDSLQKRILKTLVYAGIFDYPLTFNQLKKFLITSQKKDFKIGDIKLKEIAKKGNYFFLRGKEKIIKERKRKEKYADRKLKIAQQVVRVLRLIPFIKMVAVTGNLAMRNANQEDDIDFLIITQRKRLWLSRFLAVVLLELLGKRRRPEEKEVKDKICLNMFLDEDHLEMSEKQQNLFSAHEILQLKSLYEKDKFYDKFLDQNRWVKKFLANWKK